MIDRTEEDPLAMLQGIETGYEGKYDFPPRQQGPERTYLLATVPRAGSTHFSHLLWRTGCLGAPLEYLNFDPAGPYFFASNSAENQQQLWRSVLRRRTSPNGVFGLKVFAMQLQALTRDNPHLLEQVLATMLPRGGQRRVVYLLRRDKVAQTVSLARATMTGVWRKEQEAEGTPQIEYSQEQLEAAERGIAFQEQVWEQMFADLRLQPLRLWHEDVLADPDSAVREVADFVGVAINPEARVAVPQIEKQTVGDAAEWVERYRASGGARD